MGFEVFTKKHGRGDAPRVGVSKNGVVIFYKVFGNLVPGLYKRIQAYYDKDTQRLGFRESADGYILWKAKKSDASIAAKIQKPLDHFGIPYREGKCVFENVRFEDGMIVVDVRET